VAHCPDYGATLAENVMQSKTGERVQGVSLNALLGQHFLPPPFLVDFFDMWVVLVWRGARFLPSGCP